MREIQLTCTGVLVAWKQSDDYKAIAMGWQGLTSREGSEEKESDTPLPSTNCPDCLLTVYV